MNRMQRIGLLLAILAGMVLSSCKKEKSLENGNGSPLGPEAWEFKEGASSFKGPIDTAYYSTLGGVTALTLEGVSTDQKDDFYLQILGASITAGTYSTPTVVFEYYSNGTLLYQNDPAALNKFSVIITQIDSSGVSGTFSGEVKDTAGNVKNITDGKFTGKFNTAPPPPNPTACKLSNLASYELGNGAKISAITSFFNAQNQVTKTQLLDSSSQTSGILEHEFNFTYAASRIDVDAKQYFTLEPGGGRINQFHGYADPTSDTSLEVIINYTYDAGGYLSGATLALPIAPSFPVFTYVYQWTGGNLTKVTINIVGGEKSVIDYEYDPAKQAKGFLSFHTNPEIILFQNVINFGKNSTNVPTKSTWTDYDDKDVVIGTPTVSNFTNYIYDANGYIKSFDITGAGSLYGSEIRHVLSYKCF
jgi:hypothetical protein